MVEEVEYLGQKINWKEYTRYKRKSRAITEAPAPKNVSEGSIISGNDQVLSKNITASTPVPGETILLIELLETTPINAE